MALSANTVWEVRTAGGANAGGGFVTGASGTDYSQQDAIHSTRTDLVIDAVTNTKITSAGDAFASDDVGNIINITAGTGFTTGYYEILSVASAVATLDRAVGTVGSTGGTGYLGGATVINSMNNIIENFAVAGNKFWIKDDGTHTLTASFTGVKDGTAVAPMVIEGYGTTRGDGYVATNRAVIATGTYSFIFDNFWNFRHLDISGTGSGLDFDNSGVAFNIKSVNSNTNSSFSAIITGTDCQVIQCEASCPAATSGSGIALAASSVAINCLAYDCASTSARGIYVSGDDSSVAYCVSEDCHYGIWILSGSDNSTISNVTIDGCTTGIATSGSEAKLRLLMNVIISNCTTGMNWNTQDDGCYFAFINFYNNTTNKTNIGTVHSETTLDPGYQNAASGDFTPGSNMDAGMDFPGALVTRNPALGALPFYAAGGSGNTNILTGKL